MNVIPKRVDETKRASSSSSSKNDRRFRENARLRMIREHQEKQKLQDEQEGDGQEPLRKIVPVRFDSAPTRVRFDSAPTKLRVTPDGGKRPEKQHAELSSSSSQKKEPPPPPPPKQEPKTTPAAAKASSDEDALPARRSDSPKETDKSQSEEDDEKSEETSKRPEKVPTPEPTPAAGDVNEKRAESPVRQNEKDEAAAAAAANVPVVVNDSSGLAGLAVESVSEASTAAGSPEESVGSPEECVPVSVDNSEKNKPEVDDVDGTSTDARHEDEENRESREEEKISNQDSSSDVPETNDVEMVDLSDPKETVPSDLPVLEKCEDVVVGEKASSVKESDEEPPEISKAVEDGGGDDVRKKSDNDDAVSADAEEKLPEEEPMEVDGKKDADSPVVQGDQDKDADADGAFCAILDVRTLNVEDELKVPTDKTVTEGTKEDDGDDDDDVKAATEEKAKQEVDDKPESGKKEKSGESPEAEIKSYATDTMNELLGLFGYEKMDDAAKEGLRLKSGVDSSSADDKPDEPDASAAKNDGSEAEAVSLDCSTEDTAKHRTKEVVERLCAQCDKTKGCRYQVLVHGGRQYICDDDCFKTFRSRQIKPAPAPPTTIVVAPASETAASRPQTRSVTTPKDYCTICRREIKNGVGFLPGSGENKPVCSEECMRKYQSLHGPKRACAQCGNAILGRNKCLTWETMEFCNEDCLGKYQSYLGSHCACCNNAVLRTSLGKYCVRFGSDIKQFCSNNCLEEFKKGLKVCSFCQKDISSGTEGFLAPVGDKGQFKDFCSQRCMEKYESMNNNSKVQPSIHQCSVCNKTTAIKVQVSFEGKSHKLCSEPCIAAFRYANKIDTTICDTCEEFFDVDASERHSIQFEGTSKRFCTKTCMNVFVLSHRKIVPCTWCKVKKYNFDMIERVDSNNDVQLFCSLNCLSLFRVSLNATSSRSVRCDFCQNSRPAQYHLTMSDASIRNFCSYQCVMNFQSQFTNVAPVTPSSPVQPPSAAAATTTTQSNNGTPIISSVMSLAPAQPANPVAKTLATTTKPSVTSTISSSTIVTTATSTITSTTSLPSSPHVTQQIIIKPPPPKLVKNKAILCKPFLQTKGVSCKPHPCHKGIQKDDDEKDLPGKPVLFPIPVPIYVPTPMHMYVNPAPVPIMFPIPIPVPIFIPTTKNTAEEILQHIKEIRNKIPENPFEAELLMMAEMVAVNNGSKKNKTPSSSEEATKPPSEKTATDEEHSPQDSVDTPLQDQVSTTNAFSDDMLQMALRMATEMDEPAMDLEDCLASGKSQQQESDFNNIEDGDAVSPRELRARTRSQKRVGGSGRGRGRKRARVEQGNSPQPASGAAGIPENIGVLKFTYGVNAWKHWVLQRNTQLEKAPQSNRGLKLFKTDLLQLTADDLNYSLCLFVKEVRKPNGEEYAPDSIFYLCLGIQQYLFDNGRIDNIFTDAYYEKFTECLNEVLQRYDSIVTPDTFMMSRIEEEILWESKQLGAHSPHVLLNTLMYFNTKHFMLKTVEDHMKLSFSHVMKHWRKPITTTSARGGSNANNASRNVLLRYCPPPCQKGLEVGKKRKEEPIVFEQLENLDNPLRCPVKLYEFYLSKCPESIKGRSDVFYLYPERSCVPDSPVWYSMMPLGREAVIKMLQRVKMVREVADTFATP